MPSFQPSSPGILSGAVLGRLLAIFLPAALFTGGVVATLYYQDFAKEHTLFEQAGENLVGLQSEIITRELKSVQSDLLYLADQAVLREFLSGADKTGLEAEYLLFSRHKGIYDQIRFLDDTGQERIRINYDEGRPAVVPEKDLQLKVGRYYFTQTMLLDRGEVFISPFDLNVERDKIETPFKPVIRFATPVFDKQDRKQGVLVLNYLGAALLQKLAEVSEGFAGKAWLLNRDGYFLRGPNPEDEWGFMLGNQRTFATYYPDEWLRISQAEKDQYYTQQGLFTFRTLSARVELPNSAAPFPHPHPPPNWGRARVGGEGVKSALADPDASDPGLIVLSFVPSSMLNGRATILLQRLLLLEGVVLLLILVLAWYLAYAGALRRNQERQIADSEARLRTLSTRLITAQEDERRRLSRDLHDELGQIVTTVALDLQRAAQAPDQEKKAELIQRAFQETECLLDRIHEISSHLRPTLLDDLGLKDAVQNLLSEYEQRTGIIPRMELRFEYAPVPPAVSENVYRILQEALTNVSKHAQTKEVFVRLEVDPRLVALMVRDVGAGFSPAALDGKGLGILGMRERAELLGGNFMVKAEVGKGTEIHISIPIY
jgi:signal transduction histidine kinase